MEEPMLTGIKKNKDLNQNRIARLYMQELSRIPLLTPEEEKDLAARSLAGDMRARERLVESNLRFVVKVAKTYRGQGLPFLDLINEGNLGLIKAADRFDPARKVKFISYAVWWIRQYIRSALCSFSHPLRLPPKMSSGIYRTRIISAQKVAELDRQPTLEELASETGISEKQLMSMLQAGGTSVSLNQFSGAEGEALVAVISHGKNARSTINEEVYSRFLSEDVKQALGALSKQEQEILRLRFGIERNESLTLQQIGSIIGLSRERIRQIQERAIEKLRSMKMTRTLASYHRDAGIGSNEPVLHSNVS